MKRPKIDAFVEEFDYILRIIQKLVTKHEKDRSPRQNKGVRFVHLDR